MKGLIAGMPFLLMVLSSCPAAGTPLQPETNPLSASQSCQSPLSIYQSNPKPGSAQNKFRKTAGNGFPIAIIGLYSLLNNGSAFQCRKETI